EGNDIINGGAGADSINGGPGNETLNGGAGNNTIEYLLGHHVWPGNGIDMIDGGPDHDTLRHLAAGSPCEGGNHNLYVDRWCGVITSIEGGTLTNVESVVLDLFDGEDRLDYAGTMEAVTVNLATGTATGFTSIAGVEEVLGGSGNDALTGDAGPNILAGGAG